MPQVARAGFRWYDAATMATHYVANNAKTRNTASINDSQTSITVGDGSVLPAAPFWLTLWNDSLYGDPGDDPSMEVVECTAKATNALTVVRAQSGTSAVARGAGQQAASLAMAENIDEKFSLDAENSPITGITRTSGAGLAWDDMRFPATNAVVGASAPDLETFIGNIDAYAFDKVTDQEIFFSVQMPHSWAAGTALHPHIHWAPSDTDTGSVVWVLEYTLAEINGTFGAATTLFVADPGDGTALKHQYLDLGDISMAGITSVSAMLMCRVHRDANSTLATDDYDADAFLLEVDFHYQIDGWGSDAEASKT